VKRRIKIKNKTCLRVMKRTLFSDAEKDGEIILDDKEKLLDFFAKRNQLSLRYNLEDISEWKHFVTLSSTANTNNNFATDSVAAVGGVGTISNSRNVWVVGYCARGTLDQNRVGRRISLRALHVGGEVVVPATMTVPSACSLYLIYDRTPARNTVLPAVGDIFLNTLSSNSQFVQNYRDRFTILKKWDFTFAVRSATIENDNSIGKFDDVIYLGGLPQIYTDGDTAGNFANMNVGNLIMVAKGTTTIAVGAAGLRINAGLYFTDE